MKKRILALVLTTTIFAAVFSLSACRKKTDSQDTVSQSTSVPSGETTAVEQSDPSATPNFTLLDSQGNSHTLSDYKGKVVFLNFWATWCPPCQEEMPDLQEVYEEYGENSGDVIFLTVANPITEENPKNSDISEAELTEFVKQKGFTFPVLFDTTGDVLRNFQISAFPTTFMIDAQGEVYGYVAGALEKDTMKQIIQQTQQGGA